MSLSIATLLIHNADVPPTARAALHAAQHEPPASRPALLVTAARILHHEVGVDCADALELVGLEDPGCGC